MTIGFADTYRANVLTVIDDLLRPSAPVGRALDFGSGEGWFAAALRDRGLADEVVALDVMRREHHVVEPIIYDGTTIPFDDRSFDLVYAVDVLHHAPSPEASLAEALRVCGRYFLLKDHTFRGKVGRATLTVFDELGNRRFGVDSPRHYQHLWSWDTTMRAAGFELERRVHPAPVHSTPVLRATNGLQFIALWRRSP